MNFEQAKQEYLRLKELYGKGELSPEQYERAVLNLRVNDKEGQTWQIGLTSGAWYRKEGTRWVEDTPASGGTAVRAERTFFGAPVWLAMAVGGAGVVTVLGVFVISLFFLLNSGAFPAARVITATFGPSLAPAPMTLTAAAAQDAATSTPSPKPSSAAEEVVDPVTDPAIEDTETPEPADTASLTETPEQTTQQVGQNTPEATPTKTRTPKPSNPDLIYRVWKSISYTNFEREDAIQDEWVDALEWDYDNYDYVNYKGRNSLLFTFIDNPLDISSYSYDTSPDVEIEEVFAFPANNQTASVDLICRNDDWASYYFFNISRTHWYLSKWLEDDDAEILLDEGNTPNGVKSGEWGRYVMRCDGSQITVWLNGALLSDVEDDSVDIGYWTVSLYYNEEEGENTSMYFTSHRVYERTDDEFGDVLDRIQLNDVNVTLDQGLRKESDLYSLALSFDNRSEESHDLKAENVYLLGADGARYPAVVSPPQTTVLAPFKFPYSVKQQQVSSGLVYFRGLDDSAISDGLELVVDLIDWNLGQARFKLPTE